MAAVTAAAPQAEDLSVLPPDYVPLPHSAEAAASSMPRTGEHRSSPAYLQNDPEHEPEVLEIPVYGEISNPSRNSPARELPSPLPAANDGYDDMAPAAAEEGFPRYVVVDGIQIDLEAPPPVVRAPGLDVITDAAADAVIPSYCPSRWLRGRLPYFNGRARIDMILPESLMAAPVSFILVTIVLALGLCVGALVVPGVLAIALVDALVFLFCTIPAALVLLVAFLRSPLYGPNIKVLSMVFIPVVIVTVGLLYVPLVLVAAVILALAVGVFETFGKAPFPFWTIISTFCIAGELVFHSGTAYASILNKVRDLARPLARGETRYDIKLIALLMNTVVILVGGFVGFLVLLVSTLVLSPVALFGGYHVALRLVPKGKLPLIIGCFPLILFGVLAGPLIFMCAFFIGFTIAGVFSGIMAVAGHEDKDVLAEWSHLMKELLDASYKWSVPLLVHGDLKLI